LGLFNQLEYPFINSGVLIEPLHTCFSRLPQKLLKGDCLDIGTFALVLDDVEYQCFFLMRKLAVANNKIAKRFKGLEL
jgi:hypothetical protein